MVPSQVAGPGVLEAAGRVVVMENHDAAYAAWREAGVRQRILIHLDAHHDMWWVGDGTPITIANFICPALKEGMVREIFWVVPDGAWETPGARRPILRHLRALVKGAPESSRRLRIDDREATAVLLGKPLHVLPLRHVRHIEENVLLDIDVDYLVIPRVSHGDSALQVPVPWCWPDGLLTRLADLHLRSDLVTIAYSVEGGYTPLKWKYLGDEVALRLRGPGAEESAVRGMSLMREGALAACRGEVAAAEACHQQAKTLLPDSAAPCYHLAHLYWEAGREDAARDLYRQALARDPSYRTAYNSAGVGYFEDGRLAEAREEHQRMLALDPRDAYAHLGLGQIAARLMRWGEAEASLRTALALDGTLPDAWRALATVLAGQKRYQEAIHAYQQSLKLVLRGHKPLTDYIITDPRSDLVIDPHHGAIHVELARLYEATGALTQAITAYRFGIAGGEGGVLNRARLVRLYLTRKQWRQAAQETWQAARAIPAGAWQAGRRAWRRLRRTMARLPGAWWHP
jgi:tetratricopeptide (TPR) repeat protein